MRAVVVFACGIALAVLCSCENDPLATPGTVVNNPSKVAGNFRQARDHSANLVSVAKAEFDRIGKRDDLKDGQLIYNDAQVAFNSLITRITNALGTDDKQTRAEIAAELADANKKYHALQEWYASNQRQKRIRLFKPNREVCTSAGIIEMFRIGVDVYDIYAEVAAEQRQRFDDALKASEWKTWEEIPASGQ